MRAGTTYNPFWGRKLIPFKSKIQHNNRPAVENSAPPSLCLGKHWVKTSKTCALLLCIETYLSLKRSVLSYINSFTVENLCAASQLFDAHAALKSKTYSRLLCFSTHTPLWSRKPIRGFSAFRRTHRFEVENLYPSARKADILTVLK